MKIIAMVFALAALSAFAQDKEELDETKKMFSKHYDRKSARLNEAKACIQNASSAEGIKACRQSLREDWKDMTVKEVEAQEDVFE